jgi:hypothetical protein
VKPRPRYLLIVFALAGDSTITSDLAISSFIPRETLYAQNFRAHRIIKMPFPSYLLSLGTLQEDFQELLTR